MDTSPLSPEQFRGRFPVFTRRVYVNSCSQGALSTDVESAVHEWIHSWHEHGSPWERWVEAVEELRGKFAASIGADRDEIAVLPAASGGITAIASALDFTGPRRQVVMGEFEFPTMAQAWLAQERRGAVVKWARASGDLLPVQAYESVVDEQTLIVPATHVCFRNGHKTDIAALTALCHARGALVFLDDYQRTGSGPIDVHDTRDRLHGDRLPEIPAVGSGDWVPLRASGSRRAARADHHRVVRESRSVRVPDRRAGLAVGGQAVRERHSGGAERLCDSGCAGPARSRRLCRRWSSRSRSWSSDIARRPRLPDSSCAHPTCRAVAGRSSSFRVSMRPHWCHDSPHRASWRRAAETGCAYRSTRTTTRLTSTQ